MAKYPSLWFDSKHMKEVRRTAQKPSGSDDHFCFYVMRPISVYVSYPLYKFTNVSANSITYFMSVLGFIAPVALYFCTSLVGLLLAGLFYYFLYLLDLVDGEVARLRQVQSQRGVIYDVSLWFSLMAFYIVYHERLLFFIPGYDYILPFVITGALLKLYTTTVETFFEDLKGSISSSLHEKTSGLQKLMMLTSPLFMYLVYPLVYLSGAYLDVGIEILLVLLLFYLGRSVAAALVKIQQIKSIP